MKNESTPSDEEIRSYMNFDSLLKKRKIELQKNRVHTFLKWGVPILMITGFVGWFVITNNVDTTTLAKEQAQSPTYSSSKREVTPLVPPDSIPERLPTKQDQNEKATADSKRILSEKSNAEKELPPREDVYVQAEPVDGYTKLYDYFNTNLIYPSEALADSIQGVQTISFIVNTDGKPENITLTKSLGILFEKEARRLIENMPPWKPATLNGKPVPSRVAVPLTFQIEKITK